MPEKQASKVILLPSEFQEWGQIDKFATIWLKTTW
jgi:hypothetical protein